VVASIGAVVYQTSPLGAIQMLWVNLIMDSLGSLALATEPPTEALLDRQPYGQWASMISRPMWCNMMGQSMYQLFVVLLTLFYGEYLFYDSSSSDLATTVVGNVTSTEDYLVIGRAAGCEYTQHFTALFNVFVMMTLFNQVAARKLENEYNFLEGVHRNKYFIVIILLEALLQVVFVQGLGKAVGCYKDGLTAKQWGLCVAFGVGVWPWQVLVSVVTRYTKPDPLEEKASTVAQAQKARLEERSQSRNDLKEISFGGEKVAHLGETVYQMRGSRNSQASLGMN